MSESTTVSTSRPSPPPTTPWRWHQTWLNRLFLHFEVNPELLRARLPANLELDLYQGVAWIGVVPFRCDQTMIREVSTLPVVPAFAEVNVRTYVSYQGRPGVWFFTLEVNSRQAVLAAHPVFHLDFRYAHIDFTGGDSGYEFRHRRDEHAFAVRYKPTAPLAVAPGSFEDWCTGRRCFYSANSAGAILRAEVQREAWSLQAAEAEILQDSLLNGFTPVRMHPSILYSARQEAFIWAPQPA